MLNVRYSDLQFTCKRNVFVFRNYYSFASLLVNCLDNQDAIKPIPNLSAYPELTNSCNFGYTLSNLFQ